MICMKLWNLWKCICFSCHILSCIDAIQDGTLRLSVNFLGTNLVSDQCFLTQLFFFFFLASCSLRLPMLEWLVVLVRLERLSEEFWRLICSSEYPKENRSVEQGDRSICQNPTVYHTAQSVPLGVTSGLLRAPWMISWASVFLAFRMSMVSFNSVSSESLRKHQYVSWWVSNWAKIFLYQGLWNAS